MNVRGIEHENTLSGPLLKVAVLRGLESLHVLLQLLQEGGLRE